MDECDQAGRRYGRSRPYNRLNKTSAPLPPSGSSQSHAMWLPALLEQIPGGVVVAAVPSGRVLAANTSAQRFLGDPLASSIDLLDAFGARPNPTTEQSLDPQANALRHVIATGEPLVDEQISLARADGPLVDLFMSATSIKEEDGSIAAIVVILREAPEDASAPAGLPALPRADHLKTYAATIAERLSDTFLSTAAHELRTPLTSISGYSQLLERRLHRPELDRDHLLMLTGELRQQIERMSALTDDLMQAVTLQDGHVVTRRRPSDLAAIARNLVERSPHFPEFTEAHEIILKAPPAATGLCDAEHVDQILTNLVSNALKYSPDGGLVLVSVSLGDRGVSLSVRDNGIGMAEEDRARLWQPFARFGPLRRSVNGTGLGLYIVHHLVESNGGTIDVESEPGSGSTFTVTFPSWPV